MASQLEVMPREMQLSPPPTMPQARSYMFKQQSDLQEYDCSKGTRIRINIPRLQRTYLTKDSYLRFRLNIDTTVTFSNGVYNSISGNGTTLNTYTTPGVWFDRCGAHGLIDRIEVYDYLGGTLLEQTSNVPALVTMLNDLTLNTGEYGGMLQATEGYGNSSAVNQGPDSGSTSKYLVSNGTSIRCPNAGAVLLPRVIQPNYGTSSNFYTQEFTLPLISFLGCLSEKYVPLHNGFSIDLYLNSYQQAFINRLCPSLGSSASVQPPFTFNAVWLSNVEYCAQVLELGEAAEQLMVSTIPQVIHTKQYRYFTDTYIGGSSTSFTLQPNLNVVSLRSLLWGMRPLAYQNNVAYPAYGHRMRNFITNWNFQYGSSYLPELGGIGCRNAVLPLPRSADSTYMYGTGDYLKSFGYTQAYKELVKVISPLRYLSADSHNEVGISGDEYRIDTIARPLYKPGDTEACWYAVTLQSEAITSYVPCANQLGNITLTDATPLDATKQGYFYGLTSTCGKFMGGINLKLSDRNVISGIDTNGLSLNVNLTFDNAQFVYSQDAVFDLFAEYDAFVQVIPGVATTITF